MLKNKSIYSRFLGSLTKKGSKINAKRILDSSLIKAYKKTKIAPFTIVHKTFSRLNLFLEIKRIKIRKNLHLVPFPLTSKRQNFLKIKWLLEVVKEDARKLSFSEKLSDEISNILLNKRSKVLSKRRLANKEIISNRSNIHFR